MRGLSFIVSVASVALALVGCTRFGGSDLSSTTNNAGADSGDDGATITGEIDGSAADAGVPPDAGGQSFDAGIVPMLSCEALQPAAYIFCNDFDDGTVETQYAPAGAGGATTSSVNHHSPPKALLSKLGAADYVVFTTGQTYASWSVSFWVFLDSALLADTQFAVVTSPGRVTFTRSATGVVVNGTNIPSPSGWVNVAVRAVNTTDVTVMLTPGATKSFKVDNSQPLTVSVGVVQAASSAVTEVWIDDMLATAP